MLTPSVQHGEHKVKCEFCELTNCSWMFYDCQSLTSIDLSGLDTSNVTDMSDMFNCCYKLASLDLTPLNTSNVTDMSDMFNFCYDLTSLDLSGLDTSNVTKMYEMFKYCTKLTSIDLSGLDTSNVTDMRFMFEGCSSLTSLIITSDISKVTSYSSMFSKITTNGILTYNCAYEDKWNEILVTNQSTSKFPSTWTTKCIQVFDFVDLGLSVNWATCNVGASKPEECGLYFQWGETEGYIWDSENNRFLDADGNETTDKFNWGSYKWCNGSNTTLTKYNNNASYGTVDTLTTLELSDDAAHVTNNSCRMPTSGECQELIDNTTSAWTSVNGVNGVQLTSKKEGYTDKSIFIPAAGYGSGETINYINSGCYVWNSSIDLNNYRNGLTISSYSTYNGINGNGRFYGLQIRPVKGIG